MLEFLGRLIDWYCDVNAGDLEGIEMKDDIDWGCDRETIEIELGFFDIASELRNDEVKAFGSRAKVKKEK